MSELVQQTSHPHLQGFSEENSSDFMRGKRGKIICIISGVFRQTCNSILMNIWAVARLQIPLKVPNQFKKLNFGKFFCYFFRVFFFNWQCMYAGQRNGCC